MVRRQVEHRADLAGGQSGAHGAPATLGRSGSARANSPRVRAAGWPLGHRRQRRSRQSRPLAAQGAVPGRSMSSYLPGRDDVEPCCRRRLSQPMVVGEDRVRVEPDRCFQMQGVESPQVRHRQYPCRAIGGAIQRSEGDPVEDRADLGLVAPLANSHPSQLSLEQITRHERGTRQSELHCAPGSTTITRSRAMPPETHRTHSTRRSREPAPAPHGH